MGAVLSVPSILQVYFMAPLVPVHACALRSAKDPANKSVVKEGRKYILGRLRHLAIAPSLDRLVGQKVAFVRAGRLFKCYLLLRLILYPASFQTDLQNG